MCVCTVCAIFGCACAICECVCYAFLLNWVVSGNKHTCQFVLVHGLGNMFLPYVYILCSPVLLCIGLLLICSVGLCDLFVHSRILHANFVEIIFKCVTA